MSAMSTCEAIDSFLGIEATCGQSPARPYRRICVHEHVRVGLLCEDHVAWNKSGLCRACYDLADGLGHDCPIDLFPVDGAS